MTHFLFTLTRLLAVLASALLIYLVGQGIAN